jgi:hypothetical protein
MSVNHLTSLKFLIALFVIAVLSTSPTAYSKDNTNAGYAGSYLRMGLGARSLSMGNTGVASSFDGFATFYNPAILPYLSETHFALTYYFLSFDREFHYAGLSLPLKPSAAVAVSWIHAGVSDIQGRTFTGEPDEKYETGEDAILLSFSNSFSPNFSIGMTFKILQHSLLDIKGSGLGFDVGIILKPINQITVGVQFKDITSSYNWNTQDIFSEKGGNYSDEFPQILKAGIAIQTNNWLLVAADFEASDKEYIKIHFGAECNYKNLIYLRAGISNNTPTIGGGLAYDFLGNTNTNLDYSLILGLVGEGATHVFSWEFKL